MYILWKIQDDQRKSILKLSNLTIQMISNMRPEQYCAKIEQWFSSTGLLLRAYSDKGPAALCCWRGKIFFWIFIQLDDVWLDSGTMANGHWFMLRWTYFHGWRFGKYTIQNYTYSVGKLYYALDGDSMYIRISSWKWNMAYETPKPRLPLSKFYQSYIFVQL